MHCKQYGNAHITYVCLAEIFRNLKGNGLSNDCFVAVGNQISLACLK